MKLQILGSGTSTGVPLPGCKCAICKSTNPRNKRSRTSAVVKLDDGRNILIDASTDLRWQALQWNVERVDAVLFTHAHADHILGTDDLRSFNFVQRKSIPCYGTDVTLTEIQRFFKYIFDKDSTYEGGQLAQLTLHEVAAPIIFSACDTEIKPFILKHGKTDVLGFRVGDVGYATDCNFVPEESLNILKGVRYLVLDGLRYEAHKTHFTIPQAIEIATKIGAIKTYLTHTTHTIDYDEVSAKLPPHIELAYDGLEINIS